MYEQVDDTTSKYIHSMLLFMKQDSIENPTVKESLDVIIRCIENAYNIHPNYDADIGNRDATNLANLLKKQCPQNEPVKTTTSTKKVKKPNIKKAEKYNAEGNRMCRIGLYDDAIAKYSRAIKINPFNYLYYLNRGTTYYYQKNYEECVKDCQRSVALNPTASIAYGRLAIAQCRLHRFQHAQAALLTAVDIEPERSLYRWLLSIVYRRLSVEVPEDCEMDDHELKRAYRVFERKYNPEDFITQLEEETRNTDFDWNFDTQEPTTSANADLPLPEKH